MIGVRFRPFVRGTSGRVPRVLGKNDAVFQKVRWSSLERTGAAHREVGEGAHARKGDAPHNGYSDILCDRKQINRRSSSH